MQFDRVLALVNGTDSDADTVTHASALVREGRGKLYILYVIEIDRSLPVDAEVPDQVQRAEAVLRDAERTSGLSRADVEAELLQARETGPAVVHESAVRDVDAIVIGTLYPTELGAFSLGSDIPYILENAPAYVILLRAPQSGITRERPDVVARGATRIG